MGTSVMSSNMLIFESDQNVFEQDKMYKSVLEDPNLCKHLLLAPRVSEIKNNRRSFIGYLKKMILSREPSQQLCAITSIYTALIGCLSYGGSHCLKEEKIIITKLLDDDFVEFMCEALPCPTSFMAAELSQAIFACLALFSEEEEFFYHFHAAHALESILRSLHFGYKFLSVCSKAVIPLEIQTLSSGLTLIALIIERSKNKTNILEIGSKAVEEGSILDRIYMLITKSMILEIPSIKLSTGLVARSLLNEWHLREYLSHKSELLPESMSKYKVSTPKNVINLGEKMGKVTEIQRRMTFYHKGVQLVQTKIEESSILSWKENDFQNPDTFSIKKLELVTRIAKHIMKELVNFVNALHESSAVLNVKLVTQFLLLIFQIGNKVLRLLPQDINANFIEENIELTKIDLSLSKRNLWGALYDLIAEPVSGLCTSVLVEIEFNGESYEMYEEYFVCLELLYQKSGAKCYLLSQKFVSKGYLTLLPFILTSGGIYQFSPDSSSSKMKSSCVAVLAHLLSSLAEVDLNWPDSYLVISQGLRHLPKNIILWPSVIAKHPCEASRMTMVVFSYFYLLSTSRPEVAIPFLQPLVCFIKSYTISEGERYWHSRISSPILKALWLSFAVSYLANECPCVPKIIEATRELVGCIHRYHRTDKMGRIRDIFTYHPAILFWAFSSPVSRQWIQLEIVVLWLECCDASKHCEEMGKLLSSSQDAFICLVSVAETGSKATMECALRTIWGYLTSAAEAERKKISLYVWEILLYAMKRFNSIEDDSVREERAMNAACLMQLTLAASYSQPTLSTAIRLTWLLGKALLCKNSCSMNGRKNLYLLHLSALQMLEFFLGISFTNGDTRVASLIILQPGHLERLNWAARLCNVANDNWSRNECPEIFCFSKHIIEDLNSFAHSIMTKILQVKPCSEDVAKQIFLNPWHVLRALFSQHQGVCRSTVKLFTQLVQVVNQEIFSRPFVKICLQGTDALGNVPFLRTLYIKFLMICARASPNLKEQCWEFLNAALGLPDKNLTSHLLKVPWNQYLILATLLTKERFTTSPMSKRNQDFRMTKAFLSFVNQWIIHQHLNGHPVTNHYRRCALKNEGKGFPIFMKVLNTLAKHLLDARGNDVNMPPQCTGQDRNVTVEKLLATILQYERDIPEGIVLGLREKNTLSTE